MRSLGALVVTLVCCSLAGSATGITSSRCPRHDGAFNHVKGISGGLPWDKMEKHKLKEWPMDEPWQQDIKIQAEKLNLKMETYSTENKWSDYVTINWGDKWQDHTNYQGELCFVINGYRWRKPMCIHPMNFRLFSDLGFASMYLFERNQADPKLLKWVDSLFRCHGRKLEKFLFIDADCIKTPAYKKQASWRMVIGVTKRMKSRPRSRPKKYDFSTRHRTVWPGDWMNRHRGKRWTRKAPPTPPGYVPGRKAPPRPPGYVPGRKAPWSGRKAPWSGRKAPWRRPAFVPSRKVPPRRTGYVPHRKAPPRPPGYVPGSNPRGRHWYTTTTPKPTTTRPPPTEQETWLAIVNGVDVLLEGDHHLFFGPKRLKFSWKTSSLDKIHVMRLDKSITSDGKDMEYKSSPDTDTCQTN